MWVFAICSWGSNSWLCSFSVRSFLFCDCSTVLIVLLVLHVLHQLKNSVYVDILDNIEITGIIIKAGVRFLDHIRTELSVSSMTWGYYLLGSLGYLRQLIPMKYRFADHLRRFKDVFIFPEDKKFGGNFGYHVSLHSLLSTSEDRTRAVADVVNYLGEELIPGIRNEVLVVTKLCRFLSLLLC